MRPILLPLEIVCSDLLNKIWLKTWQVCGSRWCMWHFGGPTVYLGLRSVISWSKLLRLLTVKIQSKAPEGLGVISLWWEGEGGFEAVLGEHLGC